MPFQITRLGEIPRGEAESVLLTGPAGSGKTFFCGTAGERTAFINIGNGISTLQSPLFRKLHPNAEGMIVVTLNEEIDSHGVIKSVKLFDDICLAVDQLLGDNSADFDTLIIDDASSLRRSAMNKALDINQKTGKSKSKSAGEQMGLLTPAMQDYQTEMSLMEQMIAGTTQLCKAHKKHLIITAHQRFSYKKGDKMGDTPSLIKVSPSFTGVDKNPDQIAQYFDNVWVTKAVSGGSLREYRIVTQGDEILTAKTRWAGVFNTEEVNLTWLSALKRIRESDPQKQMVGISANVLNKLTK